MNNPNGRPSAVNGAANRATVRVAANGTGGGPKVDPSDPQVRKLVYNMYRGMLDQKHQRANVIVDNVPQDQVETDAGVGARVQSMLRQQSQLKGGGMNTAGAPPPPPPPPIPSVLPSPRLPTEIPARAPPVMNPPAALAGAMMKDKKPFTYTPGGIDLSEINSPNQNGGEAGDNFAPVQSRSFRVLQNVLSQDVAEPQGPVHIPNLRQQQKPSPQQQPVQYQPPPHCQPTSLYQQPGVVNNSASSDDAPPEPKKYMGGNIPSRSFKMLQAITCADDASDNGVPASGSEASHPPDIDTQHAASQIPSPAWKTSTQSSPPSLSPTSTLTTTNDNSSDSGISSPSKVSPYYTTTKDSKVYRNVAPKVTLNGPKQERIVNSALSAKEPPSPFSTGTSSPTWVNSHTPKFFAAQHQTPTVVKLNENDQESPRLMKIIRQESTSSQNSQEGSERRYEGGHIPSRVFRHLQTEYAGSSDEAADVKPQENSDAKGIPSRVVKSFQSSGFGSDRSGSIGELDDYRCNGMSTTAAHKDTVLKELTSQFDTMGTRKKPRAAPGKVFRQIQVQYDTPEDQEEPQAEEVHNFGYRGSKLPSPSFRFLQNQYHQQERPDEVACEDRQVHNAPVYDNEPLPYQGARLPGRTFKSLQDNGGAHPSVLRPRK